MQLFGFSILYLFVLFAAAGRSSAGWRLIARWELVRAWQWTDARSESLAPRPQQLRNRRLRNHRDRARASAFWSLLFYVITIVKVGPASLPPPL